MYYSGSSNGWKPVKWWRTEFINSVIFLLVLLFARHVRLIIFPTLVFVDCVHLPFCFQLFFLFQSPWCVSLVSSSWHQAPPRPCLKNSDTFLCFHVNGATHSYKRWFLKTTTLKIYKMCPCLHLNGSRYCLYFLLHCPLQVIVSLNQVYLWSLFFFFLT